MDRLKRIGRKGCKCFDIYHEYEGGIITLEEMNKKLDDIESKQLSLFERANSLVDELRGILTKKGGKKSGI